MKNIWTSHTSERGGRFCRVTCRARQGREKEDRQPSRMKRLAVKARSWWSASEKNKLKSRQKRVRNRMFWWRTPWASHAKGRKGRFYRATCRPRHEWVRKGWQIEWSRLLRGRVHDGTQAWRNKRSSSSSSKNICSNPMRWSQRKKQKSEDLSRREEPRPKRRNNDGKK